MTRMEWFGPPGRAAPSDDIERVATPVGELCLWCDEPVTENDSGILMLYLSLDRPAQMRPKHEECEARSILGSVEHQQHEARGHIQRPCTCMDDPNLTRREAAKAAFAYFLLRKGLT